jgi:subtilisin family serine protease
MCDTIAGELLMCFHHTDPAGASLREMIATNQVPHVRLVEDLGGRLARAGLPMRRGIDFLFYRLEVPVGQEDFKVNYLQFFYKAALFEALHRGSMDFVTHNDVLSRSDYHFQVVPHSILSLATPVAPAGVPFQFATTHDDYKQRLGLSTAGGAGDGRKVLVIDSGVDSASAYGVVDQKNFVDPAKPNDATDDNGHGTVVASIIHDLCPAAELVIYKVADQKGRASEWDTLAALAARSGAHVVNISLAFGLPSWNTATCGRESQSSRSAVFEALINQLGDAPHGPLIIAAAGNESRAELSFPARYKGVVAIESVDLSGRLSEFSNHATTDNEGNAHPSVFVLPGGQQPKNAQPTEYVGTSADGTQHCGTSFAAAYASGLIAALWSEPPHSGKSREELLDHLRGAADKKIPNYDPSIHGNGLMLFA